MKIDFEDRTWLFEMDKVTVEEGERIAAHTGGLTPAAWYRSIIDLDKPGWLKSMQCLYWLIHEQNADPVPMDSKKFAPLKLLAAFDAASGEEQAADTADEAEADPTKPAGQPGDKAPGP